MMDIEYRDYYKEDKEIELTCKTKEEIDAFDKAFESIIRDCIYEQVANREGRVYDVFKIGFVRERYDTFKLIRIKTREREGE